MNIKWFFTITSFSPETHTEHLQVPDSLLELKKERQGTCSREPREEHKQTVKREGAVGPQLVWGWGCLEVIKGFTRQMMSPMLPGGEGGKWG